MIIIAASKAREVTSRYVDDNILVEAAATIATAIVIISRLPLHLHNIDGMRESEVAEKALVSFTLFFYFVILSVTFSILRFHTLPDNHRRSMCSFHYIIITYCHLSS